MTAPEDPRDRFRELPEPVRLDQTVEEVDVSPRDLRDDGDDRDALLRQAGG
ncbi:hypothetical protein [Blastococcus sp. SYSU D00820]